MKVERLKPWQLLTMWKSPDTDEKTRAIVEAELIRRGILVTGD
jgi:hypothetical protein